MSRSIFLIPLGSAAIALLACQQETANPAGAADAAIERSYALEVQKLKSGPEAGFDAGLAALDGKFGIRTATPLPTVPEPGSALEKTAAVSVYDQTADCTRLSKFIFRADPGDRVVFRAASLNVVNVGISDPVAMLIQLDHPDFIQNGTLPTVAQSGFDILAWNDDAVSGSLTAAVSHTFQPGQSGHFMVVAYPYSNLHSTRKVSLSLDIIKQNCPDCEYIIQDPIRTLGGLVYRSQGANDFRANRVDGAGNPRLYVILRSAGTGMTNGDANFLTRNSRVYPYPVSSGGGVGNAILIDNELTGTATFRHLQYTP